jgi:hypothetical protein
VIADLAFQSISDLPFVVDCSDGAGRRFWCVEPTGDYEEDCDTGHRYALAYLHYQAGEASALQWIVAAMPREKLTGIEIGFLSVVAHAAEAGLDEAKQWLARGEAGLKRMKEREAIRAGSRRSAKRRHQ